MYNAGFVVVNSKVAGLAPGKGFTSQFWQYYLVETITTGRCYDKNSENFAIFLRNYWRFLKTNDHFFKIYQ
jgi:hypothetical protein